MKFESINITLKDNNSVLIREAHIEDADEIRLVVKEYVEESEYIPYCVGEFNLTKEDEEKWIQSFNAENSLLLVATHDNHIIGNISLSGAGRKMMKHTACIGVGMLKEWRGKGIGYSFFESVIKWAKEESQLEILWLETYASNHIGLALYKKLGFEEVGRQNNFIKVSDSKYEDNIIMTLNIKQINITKIK